MKLMKISIITVVINRVNSIERAINSILNQSLYIQDKIELIIVDGGSTDGTYEKILQLNSKYELKFISEPDKGIYDAINKGLSISTGEIIGLLHSDDYYYDNNVIRDIFDYFINNEHIDVLSGNSEYYKVDGSLSRYYSSRYFRPWMLRFGFMPSHTGTFIKKNVYDKIGHYSLNYKSAGDFEFFVRIFKQKSICYRYFDRNIMKISEGGMSSSGYKSFLRSSREIKKALTNNKILSNYFLILLRLPLKWVFAKYK